MDGFSPQSLNNPDHRKVVYRVLQAALDAVDPRQAVRRSVGMVGESLVVSGKSYDLHAFRRILVCGAGKACVSMALGLHDVLKDRLQGGAIITKTTPDDPGPVAGIIQVFKGGHPIPTLESQKAVRSMLEALPQLDVRDLVFCLISGGGSALMVDPVGPIRLEDLQELTKILLASGASIAEINTLRKHLDRIKGGGLLKILQPAVVISLVLSDVVGNDLTTIASGPTVADPSTYLDAYNVIEKYGIRERLSSAILQVIQEGLQGDRPETLKPGEIPPERVQVEMVGSNAIAAQAAIAEAESCKYHPLLLTTYLQGEARQAGEFLAAVAREVASSGNPVSPPACIVAGGETTVTLRGSGRGGRNQEMALGAVSSLAGSDRICLVCLATDGEDGPTDAAGALVTGETLSRAKQSGLNPEDYLAENNAYPFFETLGDLIQIGPTGTNVNDLAIIFAFPEE